MLRSRDLDAVAASYDPSFTFEDRRKLIRMTGDRETAMRNARFAIEQEWRGTPILLATAGDRLALQRLVLKTGAAGAESEVEMLVVSEVNEAGCFVRAIVFDPEDRAAAHTELFERYVASNGFSADALVFARAFNDHDLDRLRVLLPPDFYLDDHRRTGVGRLGADAYLASLAALWQLSHDLTFETLYIVTAAEHGSLLVSRWFGTNAEGGDFETLYICIALRRGDQPTGLEIFEIDDMDAARARFEELGKALKPRAKKSRRASSRKTRA
jgi:hypothetical protein